MKLALLSLAVITAVAAAQEPARPGGAAEAHKASPTQKAAIAPGYWHTSGSQILDSANNPVRIASVNWYGFETTQQVPGGLNLVDYHSILATIKSNGYNAIRLPFSNQMVESPIVPGIGYYGASGPINTDLAGLTSLEIMDKIVAAAGTDGLSIILDNHRSEAGGTAEANGLWYTPQYPETSWIYDWTFLAQRYLNNPTVIGMDLRNEPHAVGTGGACWGCGTLANDWQLAAERGGNAVLAINPQLLIFVEGTSCFAGGCTWWGGDLHGAAAYPVSLNVPNRLVYSPHEYGPDLALQSWFNSGTSAASLESIWFANWAYLSTRNEVPVWVGEFGTTNNASDIQGTTPGSQGQWFQTFTSYLQANPKMSWSYWALNGEDHYALLDANYSATPASALKQQILAAIQAPAAAAPGFGISAAASALDVVQGNTATDAITIAPAGGFTGRVAFYVVGMPSGVTSTFSANPAAGSTQLSFKTVATVTPGTYSLTVIGYNGSLTAETPVALTVTAPVSPSFTLSPATHALTVTQGSSASETVAITPAGGFTGNVTLTASGLPAGVTAAFTPNPVASTASSPATITLAASSAAVPGTYSIAITATSGAITASTSISLTVAVPITSGVACHIAYTIANQYPGGFQAAITLYNTGTTAISSWTLTWTFGNGQTVTQLWNGGISQTGSAVTVTSLSYNGAIPAGGSYTGVGFNGTWNNITNAIPTSFSVNGTVCK